MAQINLSPFDEAAQEVVELGNRQAAEDEEADLWEIADGLMSGAIHFWLHSRQPCADPRCTECISTGEERLAALMQLVQEQVRSSDYFHSPNDRNVGRA